MILTKNKVNMEREGWHSIRMAMVKMLSVTGKAGKVAAMIDQSKALLPPMEGMNGGKQGSNIVRINGC